MKIIYFPNETRGKADHGWLQAKFSFSFANFYNPNRERFGMIRVLNDDIIAPAMGFAKHSHRNMEIISIPLKGELAHKDSLNNESIIKTGDVQVMSAGGGIKHSEYNPSKTDSTNLLQIWLFPNKQNISPRYNQKSFSLKSEQNKFLTIVSPFNKDKDALWIHQDAYFNLTSINRNKILKFQLRNTKNGVYAFVIKGKVLIEKHLLNSKDALGISETNEFNISAQENSRILLIETPI